MTKNKVVEWEAVMTENSPKRDVIMSPLADKIIVKIIEVEDAEPGYDNKIIAGEVLAVGEDVKNVKDWDTVAFGRQSGIKFDPAKIPYGVDGNYCVLPERSIEFIYSEE